MVNVVGTHVPPVHRVAPWSPDPGDVAELDVDSCAIPERFVRSAAPERLPDDLGALLDAFRIDPGPAGAMVIRGLPVGALGATPPAPTAPVDKDAVSEHVLLSVARRLGEPVGYLPEHGGRLVQHLVPTRAGADRQVSTSSSVALMFHTETAFHPHRPHHLLLLCLRGDPRARTTSISVDDVLARLDPVHRDVLMRPRFRTAVDASFLPDDHRGPRPLGDPRPVVEVEGSGSLIFTFDADLMVGVDARARAALDEVRAVVETHHTSVVLESGDLLVIDNHRAVHGRSPYAPRYDGTDRWLQRAFVVDSLAPSAAERDGRVVVTRFGDDRDGRAA